MSPYQSDVSSHGSQENLSQGYVAPTCENQTFNPILPNNRPEKDNTVTTTLPSIPVNNKLRRDIQETFKPIQPHKLEYFSTPPQQTHQPLLRNRPVTFLYSSDSERSPSVSPHVVLLSQPPIHHSPEIQTHDLYIEEENVDLIGQVDTEHSLSTPPVYHKSTAQIQPTTEFSPSSLTDKTNSDMASSTNDNDERFKVLQEQLAALSAQLAAQNTTRPRHTTTAPVSLPAGNIKFPRFDGDSDYDQWANGVQRIFDYLQWQPENKRNFVPTLLYGRAIQFFESLDPDSIPTYKDLMDELKGHFALKTRGVEATASMWGRMQGANETVDQYTKCMLDIFQQLNVPRDDNDVRMNNYYKGLRPSIRLDVAKQNPQTFAECERLARTMEYLERKDVSNDQIGNLASVVKDLSSELRAHVLVAAGSGVKQPTPAVNNTEPPTYVPTMQQQTYMPNQSVPQQYPYYHPYPFPPPHFPPPNFPPPPIQYQQQMTNDQLVQPPPPLMMPHVQQMQYQSNEGQKNSGPYCRGCRSNHPFGQHTQQRRPQQNQQQQRNDKCFNCGQSGHFAARCVNKTIDLSKPI